MASSARIDELRKKFDENPRRYFAPLANEFRKAGDPEQAVFICQEYLPQQPGHMSGHIVYGQALFELGRDEEAKAVFETALSLDPENLIALRHLGDIARQAGDLDVARFWYQRVLESDPRNEEIAQVLMSLDATRGEGTRASAEVPPPLPPMVETSAPAAQERATPQEPARPEPVASATPLAESAEPESYEPFEGFDRTIDFDQPPTEPVPEPEPEVAAQVSAEESADAGIEKEGQPLAGAQPAQPDAEELLDLDDFSIGGTPLNVPPVAARTESAHATPVDASELPAVESSESEESLEIAASTEQWHEPEMASPAFDEAAAGEDALFGINEAGATFEPQVPEAAAASEPLTAEAEPEPVIELATDMALGLPPDEPAPPSIQPETEAAPEVFEPASVPHIESAAAEEPTPEGASEPTEEVFVTETMANLYVQQGHLADALEIYQKLLGQHPDDARLQAHVHDIKDRIYGKPYETVWEPQAIGAESAGTEAPAVPGPTIREFLRGVIAGRVAQAQSNGATPPSEPEARPPASLPAETITGSIDALFASSEPSEEDRSAASALAQAFGDWPEPTPIRGVPAHEASSELSLDHVFKANAPVPRRDDADAFSFDQFFSDDLAEGSADAQAQQGRGSPDASDDIAQFNAWLNGLKKT